MCYLPYPVCLGRKYRKVPKLNRPLAIIFNTYLCDYNIITKDIQKAKISFLQQIFRLFYKDSLGFNVDAFFKNEKTCDIQKGDFVRITCHSTKSIIRQLLLKLNYEIDDYKLLKRRKYTLIFNFYISDVTKNKNVISLDITTKMYDTFIFFIVIDLFYKKDLIQFLFYYYNDQYKED
jgi:hypothetical protein